MGDIYTNPPQSRNEAILVATINGTEYTAPPQSRIEDLLLQLKEAIEQGGGGGTTVVPNPEGEPTADLNKIQIGTNVYGVLGELGTAAEKDSTNAVTEDSTALVESGAVYTALSSKVDKVTSAVADNFATLNASGNLTDSGISKSVIPSGASSFNPLATQDEIEDIWENNARTGVHNLVDYRKTEKLSANVTITLNNNYGFAVSGNGTYQSSKTLLEGLENGKQYILSAKVISVVGTTHLLSARDSANNVKASVAANSAGIYEVPFTYADGDYVSVFASWSTSENPCSIEIEELMVRDVADTDTTFAPKADTNLELTQSKVSYDFNAKTGVHNLLDLNLLKASNGHISFNDIDFDLREDGGIRVHGTSVSTGVTAVNMATYDVKANEEYILSGCPSGLSGSIFLRIHGPSEGTYTTAFNDYGEGVSFILNSDQKLWVDIRIPASTEIDTIFYPMIRLAQDTDPTYAPPAMTNGELTNNKTDNSVIAPVENGTTASQAYAVGEHFIKDGKFCTCISAIASGGTFTKNTNYVEGTIAEALDVKTVSITAAQGITIISSRGRKIDNVVILNLYVSPTINCDGSNAAQVASIPSEYAPPERIGFVGINSDGTIVARCSVDNQGRIYVKTATAVSNADMYLSVTYTI